MVPQRTVSFKISCHPMHVHPRVYVYVVVNFSSQVIFSFRLFVGMVMYMYANKVETKEK